MEVMVGPSLSGPPSYVRERPSEDEALRRCPFHVGTEDGKDIGFRSSSLEDSSESSSSIGEPEDSDEEEEDEVVSSIADGGMASLISVEDALPVKRGLSNHYSGKSKSFTNLRQVSSVKEMKKEEKQFNKRRRVLMANKWYMMKKASFYSWQNPKSMPILADLNEEDEEEDDDRLLLPSPSSSSSCSSESLKPRMKSQSCFSLYDLQEGHQPV